MRLRYGQYNPGNNNIIIEKFLIYSAVESANEILIQ